LLPSVSPTFEWIRLAQRIPVIVRLEKVPDTVKWRRLIPLTQGDL
jgi:multidrug resistance efflux pump